MFTASQLPQQKMEGVWNVQYVIQIFHPSWGQMCTVSLSFGIFFPLRVLMETQLEIFNCGKWIWGICQEWKQVGRPLFEETRVQSAVGLKQIEIVLCFVIFLPYFPCCCMELNWGKKAMIASILVILPQGVASTSAHFWLLLCYGLRVLWNSVPIVLVVVRYETFWEVIKSWISVFMCGLMSYERDG